MDCGCSLMMVREILTKVEEQVERGPPVPRHGQDEMAKAQARREELLGELKIRVVEKVLLENSFFVACRQQVVLPKVARIMILHSTHRNKGLYASDPGYPQK